MILLQFGLGHAIFCEVDLQMSRQLQGQGTYLLPGGAFLIGVASLQLPHLTTCWSRFPDISIINPHTLQLTIKTPPCEEGLVYGGGNSSGPIGGTVTDLDSAGNAGADGDDSDGCP